PGCNRPPSWTEAHHITPWSHGGPTDLANGCLLCGFHHRLIHQGEWPVVMATDCIPDITPPPRIDPVQRPLRRSRFAAPLLHTPLRI
ncbi:MAG: HNH endonuclease, partial [Nocardioidaceae bacterium]|nr:HNH endonuclease [Nocardioidaceae bacterium]